MRLILVGFQTWGSRNSRLYHIGRKALKMGILQMALCRFSKERRSELVIKEPLPIRLFEFLSSKVHKIWKNFPARYLSEQIFFDCFCQKTIKTKADVVMFTDSGLIRCVRRASSMGARVIVLHRTLHPRYLLKILKREEAIFGVRGAGSLTHVKFISNIVKTLRECDAVFALSELEKENLCRYGIPAEKIISLSQGGGVDLNYFKPPKDKEDEPFTVLLLGNKSLVKGVPYLLLAWKRLNLKNAKLIIAGKHNKNLINLFKRRIPFEAPGHVNPLKYYHKAHVFVMPSLGDSFCRAVLEAMSCGLPVIVSESVGAKEIIEDGKEGFIIPCRNIKAIAEKIQYFYDNRKEIKSMGRNARRKAEHYPWEKFSEEVIKYLSELS